MNAKRIRDVGIVSLALATFFGGVICMTIFLVPRYTKIIIRGFT